MNTLMSQIKAFVREEEGASAVEYGLLVAGIAVAVMAGIYAIGTNLSSTFQGVANKLSTAS
jgi:pilus assembly protein Flp/PilA